MPVCPNRGLGLCCFVFRRGPSVWAEPVKTERWRFRSSRDSDSGKGQAAGRRFVQSEADASIHFEAHIGRVKLLGIALFERNRKSALRRRGE